MRKRQLVDILNHSKPIIYNMSDGYRTTPDGSNGRPVGEVKKEFSDNDLKRPNSSTHDYDNKRLKPNFFELLDYNNYAKKDLGKPGLVRQPLPNSSIAHPFAPIITVPPGNISTYNTSSNYQPPNNGHGAENNKKFDPSSLNDVIAAGGVNLQQEEELLLQHLLNRNSEMSNESRLIYKGAKPPSLLTDYHLAAFMNRISKENGIHQNYLMDPDLLELVSAACETWLSGILTKTVVLSRHRRRGIPTLTPKPTGPVKRGGTSAPVSASAASNVPRSELSKELRNLASKQKEQEEKRVSKRVLLGLEKNAENGETAGVDGKAGAEETLHRAANATAAMMTANPSGKKYSWMTSGSNTVETNKVGVDKEKGKVSAIISARGDNGLRFREIRSGNSVMLKDLLTAIEDERMGTEKAIIKGYAKLKD